jgi:6-phosphogluconolactonase (cycloisomerase 2 family)
MQPQNAPRKCIDNADLNLNSQGNFLTFASEQQKNVVFFYIDLDSIDLKAYARVDTH